MRSEESSYFYRSSRNGFACDSGVENRAERVFSEHAHFDCVGAGRVIHWPADKLTEVEEIGGFDLLLGWARLLGMNWMGE